MEELASVTASQASSGVEFDQLCGHQRIGRTLTISLAYQHLSLRYRQVVLAQDGVVSHLAAAFSQDVCGDMSQKQGTVLADVGRRSVPFRSLGCVL